MKSFRTKKNLAIALSVLLVAAIVVLYCIWQVVKPQVLYFQEDGPRFGMPRTQSAPASAAAAAQSFVASQSASAEK